ncbi:MAG TPA: hypothetical protein VFH73_13620 [Polyangia bacterium]|jgi:hypothetical protein|nr:hypothetical protein [Polyangia bacterium]
MTPLRTQLKELRKALRSAKARAVAAETRLKGCHSTIAELHAKVAPLELAMDGLRNVALVIDNVLEGGNGERNQWGKFMQEDDE